MRKNSFTRMLAAVMAVACTLSISACSSSSSTSSAAASSAAASSEAASSEAASSEAASSEAAASGDYQKGDYTLPISTKGATLSIMINDSETPGTSFSNTKSIQWEEIQAKTGLTIKFDPIPNESFQETMALRFASGNKLDDIVCIYGEMDGSQLVKYYDQGVLQDMVPTMKDYAPKLYSLIESNTSVKNAMTLPGGQIVSMCDMNLSKYGRTATLIRKDWLDKFKLAVPTTPEEYENALLTFMKNDANGNGKADEIGLEDYDWTTWRQLGCAYGLDLILSYGYVEDDSGKVVCQWTTEAYRKLLTYLHKLYTEGIVPKDFDNTAYTSEKVDKVLNNGTSGSNVRGWVGDLIGCNNPSGTIQKNQPGSNWVVVSWKDTGYGVVNRKEATASLWRSYGLSKDCSDVVAAMRLFDYLLAGDGQTIAQFGVEGKNYTKDSSGTIVPQDYTMPSGYMSCLNFPNINTDESWMTGTFSQPWLKNDSAKSAELKKAIEDCSTNVTSPFQPPMLTSEDCKQVTSIKADMKTYLDEQYSKFINGELEMNDANWNAYVAQMQELGCDKITALYQKGVDSLK